MPDDCPLFTIDLITVALALGPVLVLGVPAILARTRIARRLGLQPRDDSSLGETQRRHFGSLDQALGPLGFSPVLNFTATALDNLNLTRVYTHPAEPTVVLASALYRRDGPVHSSTEWIELETFFADGTSLLTRNAELSSLFEPLPGTVTQECRGVASVARLKQRHDARLALLTPRESRHLDRSTLLDELEQLHSRQLEHQVHRGLLVHDADGFRATPRLAWRGVWSFLNPLADNFTLSRLLQGLAVGVALPWGLLRVLPAELSLAAHDPRTAILVFVILACSNLGIGLIWGGKTLIWGLLLGLLVTRLGMPRAFYEHWSPWVLLILFTLAAAPASSVAGLMARRRARFEREELEAAAAVAPLDAP